MTVSVMVWRFKSLVGSLRFCNESNYADKSAEENGIFFYLMILYKRHPSLYSNMHLCISSPSSMVYLCIFGTLNKSNFVFQASITCVYLEEILKYEQISEKKSFWIIKISLTSSFNIIFSFLSYSKLQSLYVFAYTF